MKRFSSVLLLLLIAIFVNGQAKYVFYFIGDGMGVNQINGTEMYRAETAGRIGVDPLLFPNFPYVGLVTTYSATNSVTDSSASGTALSTGHKTYNGSIGLDMNKEALQTIAERAKISGKKVGVATSVSIDHATPGAFYAHQAYRRMYHEIALDLPKAGFDFYAGSGFLRPETNYHKEKVPSIFPVFDQAGYTIARGYDDFKAKLGSTDKMILMQKEGKPANALPYAIDRTDDDLTLAQITEGAIQFLTKNNKKGFFVMIEGGKIDWACHDNDAATVFKEVEDFDNAITVAYEFYKKHPKETLIVITADHETGGIALGTGPYLLNLKALQYQKNSVDILSDKISALRKTKKNAVCWEDIKDLLAKEMGFWSNLPISWEQEKVLRDEFEESFVKNKVVFEESLYTKTEPLAACAKRVMSEIAHISWASAKHSAGYVPVYAVGVGAEKFAHKIDNTDIPKLIAKIARYK